MSWKCYILQDVVEDKDISPLTEQNGGMLPMILLGITYIKPQKRYQECFFQADNYNSDILGAWKST